MPASCSPAQRVAPSRFAEATASDGIKPDTGWGVVVPEAVLNVVFTTGHLPLLVRQQDWSKHVFGEAALRAFGNPGEGTQV
jgi:hypothetical protein